MGDERVSKILENDYKYFKIMPSFIIKYLIKNKILNENYLGKMPKQRQSNISDKKKENIIICKTNYKLLKNKLDGSTKYKKYIFLNETFRVGMLKNATWNMTCTAQ